ncbi:MULTISPECIES: hypothetical protein [unclassified Halomonas]|uniref:hypothetical protein n=1 Tax=unclassified Halomonas TaxID=2609666 RepID=UPI001C93BE82|nr:MULTISPECIES: hypothetical protein [unclassified Halomonas]MBY5926194.1 hypothetical protein [Halomonas sp. DP4Y7-2]MBY6233236.1 hypothetical protein [Halomonas sp. DP4Y7-1]
MTPEEILDSLDIHLKKGNDIELILLKGHLILEQALNEQLSLHIKEKGKLQSLGLMFNKKVDLLVALEDGDPMELVDSVKHLKEINRIRNKLAHQLDFQDYHKDLKAWACAVLRYTPKTMNRKSTYNNMVRKAFYFLTGALIGNSYVRMQLANEESNKQKQADA